ncbi:Agglutinin receptor [Bienertia sinuspersici]
MEARSHTSLRWKKHRLRAMAATDSQKQLFTLIRDFAAEKSHGEKRVFSLKKRIEELQSELDVANAELENSKRFKDTTDQELKGFEVELSMSETSNQTLETRIASIQDEISKVGSDLDDLKNEEATLREEFISQMLKFKAEIRKFQNFALPNMQQNRCLRTSSGSVDTELIGLEKKVSFLVAQTATEEEECEREQNLHNQLQQDVVDFRRRLDLIEAIMKDVKELQNFTGYPFRLCWFLFQSSTLEEKCALFSEELQKRCICPTCHLDNSESLAEVLQAME